MRPFIGDAFNDEEFRDIISKAYARFGHAAGFGNDPKIMQVFVVEILQN